MSSTLEIVRYRCEQELAAKCGPAIRSFPKGSYRRDLARTRWRSMRGYFRACQNVSEVGVISAWLLEADPEMQSDRACYRKIQTILLRTAKEVY